MYTNIPIRTTDYRGDSCAWRHVPNFTFMSYSEAHVRWNHKKRPYKETNQQANMQCVFLFSVTMTVFVCAGSTPLRLHTYTYMCACQQTFTHFFMWHTKAQSRKYQKHLPYNHKMSVSFATMSVFLTLGDPCL